MEFVRKAVSQKKRRLVEDGYNLDLSYITPRVIAMSFPASGFSKLFRNSIDDVARFLTERHGSYYKIFNLCEEAYDYSKFDNRVVHMPWSNHHPPPLKLLFDACLEIHRWLLGNSKSVVVINCLAGKGRTGTLICSYLLFCGRMLEAQQALTYYKLKRFRIFTESTGVTQPSQVRYVHYFNDVLKGKVLRPALKLLKTVYINQGQSEFTPVMKISTNSKLLYLNQAPSRNQHVKSIKEDEHMRLTLKVERIVYGDVLCQFYHWSRMGLKNVCRLSFHTSFHDENEVVFPIEELDPFSYRNLKEYRTGCITLIFESLNCCDDALCVRCLRNLDDETEVWQTIQRVLDFRRELLIDPSQILFSDDSLDDVDAVIATSL
mmetsp:Transcript_4606/g.8770  ORF Transcript_4606/g.8770 Transcript_4606/m.8770 type:complete len:376 (-) Transcript_4606:8-1135(-)